MSRPSKMPGLGWSIPARECKLGSKLRAQPGSVCYHCYALKGRYVFECVQAAQRRRLSIYIGSLDWVPNMAELILRKDIKHFRWFDSGDLQNWQMLDDIVMIANICKNTKFWLPTRERTILKQWFARYPNRKLPKNLVVRLSATWVGKRQPREMGLPTSSVNSGSGYICPAPTQGGKCGDCRACWDRRYRNVDYKKH